MRINIPWRRCLRHLHPTTFIKWHYTVIIVLSIIGFVIVTPRRNISVIETLLVCVSGATDTGLSPVDLKNLETFQQVTLYILGILGNGIFTSQVIVYVRRDWYEQKLKEIACMILSSLAGVTTRASGSGPTVSPIEIDGERELDLLHPIDHVHHENGDLADDDVDSGSPIYESTRHDAGSVVDETRSINQDEQAPINALSSVDNVVPTASHGGPVDTTAAVETAYSNALNADNIGDNATDSANRHIHFIEDVSQPPHGTDEDTLVRLDSRRTSHSHGTRAVDAINHAAASIPNLASSITQATSHITSSVFVMGPPPPRSSHDRTTSVISVPTAATTAANEAHIRTMRETARDWKELAGEEYHALKLLQKLIFEYYVGSTVIGVICLLIWVHVGPPRYSEYLASQGVDKTWWAVFTAQSMVNNQGFSLTPDSMNHFADATFPTLVMMFLAFVGNTGYPIMLYLTIWLMAWALPTKHRMQKPLRYLLTYPRRCYTLLFPGRVTLRLSGILFLLTMADFLTILLADLHNPAINQYPVRGPSGDFLTELPKGNRVLAAFFQAVMTRHTGASIFNIVDASPAVQIVLLVMMYIAPYPMAITIRASDTYDHGHVARYRESRDARNRTSGYKFVIDLTREQLSFDGWYIFVGVFCVVCSEAGRIFDKQDSGFSMWSILFEVVSAYGNVGLSLGYPGKTTSLCGEFNTFSKIVVILMMLRGRHRGLPYNIDPAVVIPGEDLLNEVLNEGRRQVERLGDAA